MLWRTVALSVLLALLGGCTANRLRHHTIKQGNTLVDLQYQQILDNLALFAHSPAAIPWHMNLREGTTQITDSASGGAAIDLGPPTNTLPQLFGSRTIVGQWGMTPVVDSIELRLLRYAYRRASGIEEMPDDEFLQELGHEIKKQVAINSDLRGETEVFFEYQMKASKNYPQFQSNILTANHNEIIDGPQSGRSQPDRLEKTPLVRDVTRQVTEIQRDLSKIRSGWFQTGRKRDVPHHVKHVGQYKDCYVWVDRDGEEQLASLTLTVLKFSSLIKETQTLVSPGSIKFSPGDRN